jgi:lipoate-protein ligase A
LTRLIDCLVHPSPEEKAKLAFSLTEHATTAERAAGRPVAFEEARQAMAAGFANALALELRPGELTDAERLWATELARDKYGSLEWTQRA